MIIWFRETMTGMFHIRSTNIIGWHVFFENEADAALFKMWWK